MEMTTFRRTVTRTDEVEAIKDGSRYYSLERKGPANWKTLRSENWGQTEAGKPIKGLVIPEVVRLVSYGFQKDMENIISGFRSHGFTGNTLLVHTPAEIYAVDFPNDELIAQLGVDDKTALERITLDLKAKLGGNEERGVIYSPDGLIRQTKREGIITETLTPLDLSTHRGVILLSGSLGNAGLVALIADSKEYFRLNPKFWASSCDYGVRVGGLCFGRESIGNSGLDVGSDDSGDGDERYTFGGFDSDAKA